MKVKYKEIAEDLRKKINSDHYRINQKIPSEQQLQKQYGVSRHTIRLAISLLVNEGYLRKEKGSGTYVDNTLKKEVENFEERKTIGVITTYLSDYIFPDIIRGIEKKLSEEGYSLLLASTNNNYMQEKECLEKMVQQNVQGLIVEPTKSNQFNPNIAFYSQLKEKKIPIIMINASYEDLNLPKISVDDELGGFLATESMVKKNHRNILLVTKIDDLQGKYRMRGFIKCLEENNIIFNSENILTYTTETESEVLDTIAVQIKRAKFTGIVAYNDELASKIIYKLAENNLSIPENISIIGNDNSSLSKNGPIPFASVNHPKEELGVDAANWIVKAIQSEKNLSDITYIPCVVNRPSIKKVIK